TPEQTAIIADLHWLVHQGHVIEFANGVLETAKKPAPRPPKPERKVAEGMLAAPMGPPAAEPTGEESQAPAPEEGMVVETPAAESEPVAGTGIQNGAAEASESGGTPHA